MIKELLNIGLGTASIIKENVEKELKNLEDKGKLSKDDIKTFIESLEEKGKEEDAKLKEHFKNHIKDIIDEFDLVTKKDLENLKQELNINNKKE